jgi:hypothetical protein
MAAANVTNSTQISELTLARDAESNLSFILGITIFFHVLALIAVILRIYVRTMVIKVMGWDDYTMIIAMVRFLRY